LDYSIIIGLDSNPLEFVHAELPGSVDLIPESLVKGTSKMKEETNDSQPAAPAQPDTDLVSLLHAMQQQLVHLEKKVDQLLSRSQEKSFEERPSHARSFGRRPVSRPFRSHEHSHPNDKREREHGPRDRDSVPGHFYERRPQEKARRPGPKKKPYAFKRDGWDK
jgi:hypothetical protein